MRRAGIASGRRLLVAFAAFVMPRSRLDAVSLSGSRPGVTVKGRFPIPIDGGGGVTGTGNPFRKSG